MKIHVRRAEKRDLERIEELLVQVCNVHAEGRPDLFVENRKKYSGEELELLIRDDSRPVFVGTDEQDRVKGYAFCIVTDTIGSHFLKEHRELYLDDLCVDALCRGEGVGAAIYDYVVAYAREIGCYHLTLNVWACNPGAMAFYEARGMKLLKKTMEVLL